MPTIPPTLSPEQVAHYVARAMHDVSSAEQFASACSIRDREGRYGTIGSLVYEAVKDCGILKEMNGQVWCYDGAVYVHLRDTIFQFAIEHYLKLMRVSVSDIHRDLRHFLWKAHQAMHMGCQLEPSYHIMAFRNGVVNFDINESGSSVPKLLPFSPDHHVVYRNTYSYDPTADCPIWKAFLREVLPERESRLTLQMFLGLGLYNRGKMSDKVENCLMLFGIGSNGKSVIHETVKGVFGAPNISEMGLMSLIRGGDEKYRNMNKIDGKVFNYCPEVQARDISMYSDAFKSLCSGENQYARIIGKDIYTVKNVPWLIFNMNNMPKSTDSSYGFFRRFLYIVFDIVIPDEKQNKHLAKDLENEYPGILNWVRRGRQYLKERKYQFPISESSERRKILNIGESNPTLAWIKMRGIRCASFIEGETYTWIPGKELYNDMEAVSNANGFTPDSQKRFALEMHKYGWAGKKSKKRSGSGVFYRVYGINPDSMQTIPDLIEMDIPTLDEFDTEVTYDPADIY